MPPAWVPLLIGFLKENLPRAGEAWGHMFSTAYQIGCEALVALGQADEEVWGATPRAEPRLPQVLPRWDDLCVAALGLAEQQDRLEYRRADGGRTPPRLIPVRVRYESPDSPLSGRARDVPMLPGWTRAAGPQPPPPNIGAATGLGLAWAHADALALFQSLGLIADKHWSALAETVLWRCQPAEWRLDPASDRRFQLAVEKAVAMMPDNLRAEIEALATLTDDHLMLSVGPEMRRLWRERPGPTEADAGRALDLLRQAEERERRHRLDWLFFRLWRLDDGWLSPGEAKRALERFHDPLAIAMRRAVVGRLHPGFGGP